MCIRDSFWRRWHITLGAWMRDYLFYPLSLSKPFGKLGKFTRKHLKGKLGKILPTSLATFLVYFVIGIWHGANWRYVAFGFWNGGIITLSLLLAPYFLRWKQALRTNDKSHGWHLFQLCLVYTSNHLKEEAADGGTRSADQTAPCLLYTSARTWSSSRNTALGRFNPFSPSFLS